MNGNYTTKRVWVFNIDSKSLLVAQHYLSGYYLTFRNSMSGSVDTDTVGNMDDRAWPVAAAAATAAVGSPVTGTTCDDSALSTLAPSLVDMHVK